MKNVTIIGGRAITAENLLNILVNHSEVEVRHITTSSGESMEVEKFYPQFAGKLSLNFEPYNLEKFKDDTDVYFLCVGHGEGFEIAKELYEKTNALIIDLSANFRLENAADYDNWYKFSHPYPEMLPSAAYGLTELNAEAIGAARLIACHGCYPTSFILGITPLLQEDIVINPNVTFAAISGISGAGRKALEATDFSGSAVNIHPYKIGFHQHTAEMEQGMKIASGNEMQVLFIPQVGDFPNGISGEIVVDLKESVDLEHLKKAYSDFYSEEPFVKVLDTFPELKNVVGTNNAEIFLSLDERTNKLVISVAIDNTIKGASGQAVQNMNLCLGFPETQGFKG